MPTGRPSVSVVIRTLAEARRRDALFRAIRSIQSQEGVTAVPIVVANGNRFDPDVLEWLKSREGIRFFYVTRGGLPAAMRLGREVVETPFFCFLDDDDEYLPNAMANRIDVMVQHEDIDVVVGNGFRIVNGERRPSAANINDARRDPLIAIQHNNWLTSCGGLYRTSTVGQEVFDNVPHYNEWTYLAYKLCLTRKLAFLDNPGYIIGDTEGSLSKTTEFDLGHVEVLDRLLELDLPSNIRRRVLERRGAALHHLASRYLTMDEAGKAWKLHLKSLIHPGGFQYGLFTRKFFGF